MNFPLEFIKASNEYNTLQKNVPAPIFRRSFTVEKPVKSADILITGLGFYELYVNGKNITKGFLAPYRSNPDDIIYYDKYDLLPYITAGKNTVAVILGNGMINGIGGYVWDFDKARFRSAPQTAFGINIEYTDSAVQEIISDGQTLTHPSPITFDDLHYGEYYDARLEVKDFSLPDFDDSDWTAALSAQAPRGETRLCRAEPIKVRNKLKCVSVTKCGDGYIYDFGVNSSGVCMLKINGKNGQKVLLQHFEILVDGKPFFANNRFNINDRFQEDEYICAGGNAEYVPHFTYHGFRYVYVTGITQEQATEDLLTYLELSSDIKIAGHFECSDTVINKIQEATLRSDISNFYYFPTDCPQREKNGWTADAALSAEQMLLNLTPENSYAEWLRNIYMSMRPDGAVPGIVPTADWGYVGWNGPAWDCVIAYLPYYTYIYTGNTDILKEAEPALMRYLNYLYSKRDDKGLIAFGLGDWCQPSAPNGPTSPLAVTDTAMSYDIAKKSEFIFEKLHLTTQRDFARTLANDLRKSFRENLIDYDTLTVAGDCQTSQALALYHNLFEDSEKPQAIKVLLETVERADGHFACGVIGGRIIYRLLADLGYEELAYEMITKPNFPSYADWILRGATTLYESFIPEGCGYQSLNHHFWGDVSAWFYIYLAGICVNPDKNDASRVDIQPYFAEKLNYVKAEHTTPFGALGVEWKKADGKITLKTSVTGSLHGTVYAPQGYVFADGKSERPIKSESYTIFKKA